MKAKQQEEQLERIWDTQLNYSMSQARLRDACEAMAKSLQQINEAMSDIASTARALGGLVVEIPTETFNALPADDRARVLADRERSLLEIDVWIASTKAAHEILAPAAFALADASAIFHNAERGHGPEHVTNLQDKLKNG